MSKVVIRGVDTSLRTQDFTVETVYIDYSPYLSGAYDMMSRTSDSDTIVIEGIDLAELGNYLSFLVGNDFQMSKRDEMFFDFMGHPNNLRYPLPYWRVKLKSKWTRDNFYRLNLCNRDKGLYGLHKVRIVNNITFRSLEAARGFRFVSDDEVITDVQKTGVVLAGGAALYMSGYTSKMNDLDFFSLDRDKSIKFIQGVSDYELQEGTNTLNKYSRIVIDHSITDIKTSTMAKASLIKRSYTCPSEVVHGFDLDVSQFICINENGINSLYATDIALYTATNAEQWLDPELASTTYIQRLLKYSRRGIRPRLPLIARDNLAKTNYPIPFKNVVSSVQLSIAISPTHQQSTDGLSSSEELNAFEKRNIIKTSGIPTDVGSILIMMSFYGMTSTQLYTLLRSLAPEWQKFLEENAQRYDGIRDPNDTMPIIDPYEGWIDINPMRQTKLTGILYPTSMGNLISLYRKSPLYKRY